MSFHVDFIEHVEREVTTSYRAYRDQDKALVLGVGSVIPPEALRTHLEELMPFFGIVQHLRQSKVIRMSGQQSQVFLDTPAAHGQDYRQWLRLPFDHVYIQLDQPMAFHGYTLDMGLADYDKAHSHEERERLKTLQDVGDPMVKGVLLYEAKDRAASVVRDGELWDMEGETVERVICLAFLMPLPDFLMNMHSMTIGITSDNTLKVLMRAQDRTRERMLQWAVNTINFLSSPTIKLVQEHPPAALQKARQRRGKPPLPGWYCIAWRHQVKDYGRDNKITTKAWEHSYRYDVRGFQRTYRRGAMAGRVVWVKSHQRGLKHTLYKPAIREMVP